MIKRDFALFVPVINGKIVLQDRSNIMKNDVEWGLFGGGIEEGETPEKALVREIKEEMEYKLTTYKKLGKYNGEWREYCFVAHVYYAFFEDTTAFTIHEGAGLKLFSFTEAQQLPLTTPDKQFLRDLQQRLKSEE